MFCCCFSGLAKKKTCLNISYLAYLSQSTGPAEFELPNADWLKPLNANKELSSSTILLTRSSKPESFSPLYPTFSEKLACSKNPESVVLLWAINIKASILTKVAIN